MHSYATLLVESFVGTNYRNFASLCSFANVYSREILVFRSLAKVYTRNVFQVFELAKRFFMPAKFSEICAVPLPSFCFYFSVLSMIDENKHFVFVNTLNLI